MRLIAKRTARANRGALEDLIRVRLPDQRRGAPGIQRWRRWSCRAGVRALLTFPAAIPACSTSLLTAIRSSKRLALTETFRYPNLGRPPATPEANPCGPGRAVGRGGTGRSSTPARCGRRNRRARDG